MHNPTPVPDVLRPTHDVAQFAMPDCFLVTLNYRLDTEEGTGRIHSTFRHPTDGRGLLQDSVRF